MNVQHNLLVLIRNGTRIKVSLPDFQAVAQAFADVGETYIMTIAAIRGFSFVEQR